jgi:hypothetical protein
MSTTLHRLLYYSQSALDPAEPNDAAAIRALLAASRRNNPPRGITGVLMFTRCGFAQVLEGPRVAIEEIFDRIQQDPRHEDVRVVAFEAVTERLFCEWAMGFVGRARGGAALDAATNGFDEEAIACIDADNLCRRLRRTLEEDEYCLA